MRKRLGTIFSIVAIAFVTVTPSVFAAAWTNAGDRQYTANIVEVGGAFMTGPGGFTSLLGVNTGAGNPWINFRQASNPSIVYSMHNAANGVKWEFAVKNGNDTHWSVINVVANGNVEMGYTGDQVDLSVNGSITTRQLTVRNDSTFWGDYVFDKSYELKPLNHVENYINQNSHLEGIPSAAEIERDGISVGDMQAKQMIKIEELTLYVIQLKKEIEELKKTI